MIKSKLTLFKMQVKCTGIHTTEMKQARFDIPPEAFNSVDVNYDLWQIRSCYDQPSDAYHNQHQPDHYSRASRQSR